MIKSLLPRTVHKVWGRRDIPATFGQMNDAARPIGEIWFEAPAGADADLLVKFLFTSERLSIQVHPDDAAAQEAGHARGKDEAWLILSAEPDARIALGTRRPLAPEELRQAALDGSIVDLVDWRPVSPGDFIYSPAGTIHAIGGGISLIEVQQNCGVTYRLYDYGRDRELHLDAGLAAARSGAFENPSRSEEVRPGRTVLFRGGKFVVERWQGLGPITLSPARDRPLWITPLAGGGRLDGKEAEFGSVWRIERDTQAGLGTDVVWLVSYPGAEAEDALLS
jgi:mannose-6-phosphate isomerase